MYYVPGETIESPYNIENGLAVLKREAEKRADFNEIIKTHPLTLMRNKKRYDLLSHDLVLSYLRQKWNRNARRFYYLICILYAMFIMLLSLIIFKNADYCYHSNIIANESKQMCSTQCPTCNITTLEDFSPTANITEYEDDFINNNTTLEDITINNSSCITINNTSFIFIERWYYNVNISHWSNNVKKCFEHWDWCTSIPCLIKLLINLSHTLLLYFSPIYISGFIMFNLAFTIWRINTTDVKLGTIFELLMCFLTLSLCCEIFFVIRRIIIPGNSYIDNFVYIIVIVFVIISIFISIFVFIKLCVKIIKISLKISVVLIFLFIIIAYIIFCLVKSKQLDYLTWQCDLLLLVNLLAWINLFKLFRKLPRFGVYVLIVWSTIKTFLRMIPLFLLFIIPFSISFFVMLTAASEKGFLNLVRRILYTIVFLLAEFDYDSKIAESGFWLTYLIFFLYLFVGTVFLMNLLTGIAVMDVGEALEDAANERICLEFDMIFDVESILYSLSEAKLFKYFYKRLNDFAKELSTGNEIRLEEEIGSWNFRLKKFSKIFGLTKELSKNKNKTIEKLDVIENKLNKLEERKTNEKLDAIVDKLNKLEEQKTNEKFDAIADKLNKLEEQMQKSAT